MFTCHFCQSKLTTHFDVANCYPCNIKFILHYTHNFIQYYSGVRIPYTFEYIYSDKIFNLYNFSKSNQPITSFQTEPLHPNNITSLITKINNLKAFL